MNAKLTWWGAGCMQFDLGDRRLVVDPYMHPRDTDVDYVCITHDHYDHLYPETLEALTGRDAFKRLMVPRSAAEYPQIDSPIWEKGAGGLGFVPEEKLTVMYPKYARDPGRSYEDEGVGELELEGITVETIDSGERPWRAKGPEGGTWPAATGRFLGHGEYPNLGYVINDHRTDLTFYATGDLGEVFDAQRQLRGRIDYMFMPIVKLEGIELSLIRSVQPRYVVPVHYRVNTPEYPVPLSVSAADVPTTNIGFGGPRAGADPDIYRMHLQRKIAGHWIPTSDPPLDRIQSLESRIRRAGSELLLVEAGRTYEIPSNQLVA
jgi:L-ascorbate metabolism protein UlaG (beta-lactamase superfamily)